MKFVEELRRRNVIRVGLAYVLLGWVVLQAADFALDLIDAPNWIIQVFFIAGLTGLPIALFFAWAFEITPEGIKREAEVDRSQSITPQTGRKLDRAIIGFLVAAVALLLVDRWRQPEPPPPGESDPAVADQVIATPDESNQKSIAVLPFVNMSSDAEQEFFSDGISEEILNALAKVDALKVAGRTSSFAFKGRNEDLREIGETLGVKHILEGSVRKADDRVRITAQLIQVEDGFHLWSETYDRELTDIFAIQDDIANRILEAMKSTLEVEPAKQTPSLAIADYNKFLMARQLMREREEAPLLRARALFTEVNESAPEFSPAWAEHAITVMLLRDDINSYGNIPSAEALAIAKGYLDRAEFLDPEEAIMHAGLGLYYDNQGKHDEAVEHLRQALELNPNLTDARNWLWRRLWLAGDYQEAVTINEGTRARDPLYRPTAGNLVWDYLLLGREAAMAAHLEQIRAQVSVIGEQQVRGVGSALDYMRGEYAAAVKAQHPDDETKDLWSWFRANALIQLGEPEWAASIAAGSPGEISALANMGRIEEGIMAARPMVARGDGIHQIIDTLVGSGRHDEAVGFFEQRWSSIEAFEEQVSVRGLNSGLALGRMVEAYRAIGDEDRSEEFLLRYGEVLAELDAAGAYSKWLCWSRAYHATLLGDDEQALDYLEAFDTTGHIMPPNFTTQWRTFEQLRGDERFEALLARINERRDEQRAELDLPPYGEKLPG